MAARKRGGKIPRRFPRTMLSLLSLILAAATGYVAGRENAGSGLAEDSGRVFASFAALDVDLEGLARMHNSPLPPRNKPFREKWAVISHVSDGDTIKLSDGRTVRLIGVDAPESSENRKLQKDLAEMSVIARPSAMTALGKEATAHAKMLAEGKRCWLEYEREKTDLYGRTLAYVHLEDGVILNEAMLRDGFAKAYLKAPFRYKKRYIVLQSGARFNQRGLWRKPRP